MTPASATEPRVNVELGLREFSRYEDVKAALREPALWPVAPLKAGPFRIPDQAAQQALRTRILDRFSPSQMAAWQSRMEGIVVDPPARGPVDLVADFIEPWCLEAAGIVTGAPPQDWNSLAAEARIVSHAAAEPLDEDLRQWATQADQALASYFAGSTFPMPGPTFIALSRTVACLLANGFVVLLQHPHEREKLRTNLGLLPKGIEEMLRMASIPDMVFRHATATVTIMGVLIAADERVVLRLASANRDPGVFSNPTRFDLTRRAPAHLSLGFGLHACAGSALIRMTMMAATSAFLACFGHLNLRGPIAWEGGCGFRSPRRLLVG
ncbi:MAG TPA: cytochrome P450 [Bryobacteraceae bacterium]|nr:cytochrome P450 [Bryobacteraceae bacterium]